MTHPQFGKWVERIRPGDSVADVVRQSLRSRLSAVQYYLPLAADRAHEDVEYVHQLRVYTRRSMAALSIYQDVLPQRRSEWVRRQLRNIRQAAGQARDFDVMVEQVRERESVPQSELEGASAFERRLRQGRSAAQAPILEVRKQLADPPGFDRRIEQLLERVREHPRNVPGKGKVRFDSWAQRRLRPIAKQFFRDSTTQIGDLHALHRFRIRGKKMRYAMELLCGGFPPEFRSELYPVVEQLQEILGKINDNATGMQRLQHWIGQAEDRSELMHLTHLLQQENEQLDERLSEYVQWWTPRRAGDLKADFKRMMQSAKHDKH